MTTNNITDTPWKMEHVGRGAFGIWDAKRRRIAETVSAANTQANSLTPADIEASARLMTASPALLTALEALQLVAFDAAVNSIPKNHVTLRRELAAACSVARDAIRAAVFS